MFYFFARNSENIQDVDTALVRARVVCEVDLVLNGITTYLYYLITFQYEREKVKLYIHTARNLFKCVNYPCVQYFAY